MVRKISLNYNCIVKNVLYYFLKGFPKYGRLVSVLLWSNWKVNFKFKLPGIFETENFFFHKLVVLLVTSVPNFTSKYSLVFELRFFLLGIKI